MPAKDIGNDGSFSQTEHGVKIVWTPKGDPAPTIETFVRVNWTSETEMNGISNKYSPLVAQKMAL